MSPRLVGGFDGVADAVSKRELGGLARIVRRFGGPVSEARAEAVYGRPLQLQALEQVHEYVARERPPCLAPGKTKSFVRTSAISLRMARARADNGTRCSRSIFMRGAGMIHIR